MNLADYTPQMRATFEAKRDELIGAGIHPGAAEISARNIAEGVKMPPRKPTRKVPASNNATSDDSFELPRAATALELMERDMPPIAYLADPWLPEGLNITAGRPKIGKSTLIRQKLAAVAGGGALLQSACTQALAVFLSLEEGDRLTRRKFEMAGFEDAALANILLYFQWRRGTDGVLDLTRILDDNEAIRYVAIDSLTRFRTVPDNKTPPFVADYEAVSALHAIAKSRPGLCLDIIHHTRKAKGDDPLDDISGTYGLTAACDSYWVLRHHEGGAVLHVGGRLWEGDTSQFQLSRADQRWELVGEYTGNTAKQNETLAALRKAGGLTPSQVAKTFGIEPSSAHQRLASLVGRGLVESRDGRYFAKSPT